MCEELRRRAEKAESDVAVWMETANAAAIELGAQINTNRVLRMLLTEAADYIRSTDKDGEYAEDFAKRLARLSEPTARSL